MRQKSQTYLLNRAMKRLCLIAEANPFIARLLQLFAEKNGLTVKIMQVGQDVLAAARREKPVVIILDPELPGKLRGWDIIRQLKADTATNLIPLIACSWMDETALKKANCEIDGNLLKPEIYYEDFVNALKQAGIKNLAESVSMNEKTSEERFEHE
jgi:CheY-like chemotaxis protein